MKTSNIFEILINFILRKIRGKVVLSFGGLPASEALVYIFRKGLFAAIRGFVARPFFGAASGLVFVGKGVNIITTSKLYVGKNFYIGDYSCLNCYSKGGVHIGNNVTIREFAWLQLTSRLDNPGESIVIGNDTYIGPRVNLGAGSPLEIGSRCQIGANVSFIGENHKFAVDGAIFDQGVTRSGIRLGNDCWVGNGVIILDGVRIGDGVVIGAGAVVTRDMPALSVVVGVPAHVLRMRQDIGSFE